MASHLVVEAPVVISRANSAATSAAVAEGGLRARQGGTKIDLERGLQDGSGRQCVLHPFDRMTCRKSALANWRSGVLKVLVGMSRLRTAASVGLVQPHGTHD